MSKTIETKVDGTPLTKKEMARINELIADLYSPTTVNVPTGHKTREILEIRGVISPSVRDAIKISSKPNTWIVPKENISDESDLEAFRSKMKDKYKLK